MDRRSWPWKKKSSDKAAAGKAVNAIAVAESQGEQENYKKPSYVQISLDAYSHLTSLEDQVKAYEDQFKDIEDRNNELEEKLSAAHSEISTKEALVKQHSKVAEEAVSGWEKAEAEAADLKTHLESVTLTKLSAEDRASRLDGALKECTRQIRNLKEDHEQELHEVVLMKTKQWEIIKGELETRMENLEQEILHSAAEGAALSRSLQEHSSMIIMLREEKSQAEADIELLKNNVESSEREINSLKYELHVASRELEIRNEEKSMCTKSAEVADKQYLEGAKKIAKLEAECQRLRQLVRKKLPGPAALAQMKLEAENLGRDSEESRLMKSPVKPHSPHSSSLQKGNELLVDRLLEMEEETKLLKEALMKCNGELLSSRNDCATTTARLECLEAQLQIIHQHRSSPKSNNHYPTKASMFEDGNDDAASCAESYGGASVTSEFSQFKKGSNSEKSIKVDNANHLELMDDFLEMEKLACIQNDSNGTVSVSYSSNDDIPKIQNPFEQSSVLDITQQSLDRLRSRISLVFESNGVDMRKILEDIKDILQDSYGTSYQDSKNSVFKGINCPKPICDWQVCFQEKEISLPNDKHGPESVNSINKELGSAISSIHDFLLFMGKEALPLITSSDDEFNQKIKEFSAATDKVLCRKMSLVDFIHELSHVLAKARELGLGETRISDCIDKIALPEDKLIQDSVGERYRNASELISGSISHPEVPQDGNLTIGVESNNILCNHSFKEFEVLISEKDDLALDLARCTDDLERKKSQLHEMEQLLQDARSEFASAQKMNSLAETQLKCMAESYRSLEMRTNELEGEVHLLRVKTGNLENELQEEKNCHQDTLLRYQDLQDQLKRDECCSVANDDPKTQQDRELAAAAEKLAECQETIFVLARQLKALHPPAEANQSPHDESEPARDTSLGRQASDHQAEEAMDSAASPMSSYVAPSDPDHILRSPIWSTPTRHRQSKSGSYPSPVHDKQPRGISRFFSSKQKMVS